MSQSIFSQYNFFSKKLQNYTYNVTKQLAHLVNTGDKVADMLWWKGGEDAGSGFASGGHAVISGVVVQLV